LEFYFYVSQRSTRKYFQKKKQKKRKPFGKVKGFQKASFFEKILPSVSLEMFRLYLQCYMMRSSKGGDFFKNPTGLNFLFGIPGTLFCCLFLCFLFCNLFQILNGHFLYSSKN
jgi:hypothetical protein